MTNRSARQAGNPGGREEAPKRKNYRLRQSKLDAAQKVLGTKTETETIEQALDLVAFGEHLASGTERARERPWNDIFGEMHEIGSEGNG